LRTHVTPQGLTQGRDIQPCMHCDDGWVAVVDDRLTCSGCGYTTTL
jgi:ribosomal protein S27AE